MARETTWHQGPVRFDGVVEPLPWGGQVYVVIKVPEELAVAARAAGTRRVGGTIEREAVNLGLNRADVVPESFLYVGAALRRRLGVCGGEVVECVLAPADPDEVPVPADVLAALEQAGRREDFERLGAPARRRLLLPVEDAVRPDTRRRRIAVLLDSLPAGAPER